MRQSYADTQQILRKKGELYGREKSSLGLGKTALVFAGQSKSRYCELKKRHGEMEKENLELRASLAQLQALRETDALRHNAQKLESLGVLAGGIAHDFNNLLCSFFGFIDLAKTISKDDQVTRYLSSAMSMIGRARSLTQQLLSVVKGGATEKEIIYLPAFILDSAQFALNGADVSCDFDIPDTLRPCKVDKNQIGQVIDNIIINALQAMPTGGTIEVSARNIVLKEKDHAGLPAGEYVKISIKDSGVGIPEKIVPHIFDPFYTTKSLGHGLGLATCRSIINGHHGAIEVESLQGEGSAFHVYLPASGESAVVKETAAVRHKGCGTFLVMDDQMEIRETFRLMLEGMGYSVAGASNGKDAFNFFLKETGCGRTVSGMIFDLTIPGGMGGKEIIAGIRKVNKEIPVFAASGYSDNPVMQHPSAYGFTSSICKPFSINELSEILEKHVKKA